MKLSVVRTDRPLPPEDTLAKVRDFLFGGVIDGFNKDDKGAWRRFWKRLTRAQPGEIASVEMIVPRSGPFHRRHMALEQAAFDAQERFEDFEQFRIWLKVGAGWVDWAPGPTGGVVPIPRSISYAKADDDEFRIYHGKVVGFMRSPHFARHLWKHLSEFDRVLMVESILEGLD